MDDRTRRMEMADSHERDGNKRTAAEIRAMVEEIDKLSTPNLFWVQDDAEIGWESAEECFIEGYDPDHVLAMTQGRSFHDCVFVAARCLTVDRDGDPDDWEVVIFTDRAEAEACWETSIREAQKKAGIDP